MNSYHKKFTGVLTDAHGIERHFLDGVYGREGDQPAVVHPNGRCLWYVANPKRGLPSQAGAVLHRENGPALITEEGAEYWYRFGKIHREDGPAITLPDGTQQWWNMGNPVKGECLEGVAG